MFRLREDPLYAGFGHLQLEDPLRRGQQPTRQRHLLEHGRIGSQSERVIRKEDETVAVVAPTHIDDGELVGLGFGVEEGEVDLLRPVEGCLAETAAFQPEGVLQAGEAYVFAG